MPARTGVVVGQVATAGVEVQVPSVGTAVLSTTPVPSVATQIVECRTIVVAVARSRKFQARLLPHFRGARRGRATWRSSA